MRSIISICALALAIAAPAAAQSQNGATLILADAAAAPSRPVIIDGASWHCEGAECVAAAVTDQPASRACRRIVARLGALAQFTWRGAALTPAQIAACNA